MNDCLAWQLDDYQFSLSYHFCLFGNLEIKGQRLEAYVIIQKYAKYAEYVKTYAITYAEKYAINF